MPKTYTTAQLKQVFKVLLTKECNKTCADCRAKAPRWYSANLGLFLCINCAGHHRSLGTHITFVQSFNLDTPKLKDLKTLKKWGNARGNGYWEARAAESDIPEAKDRNINSRTLKKFIINKYEHRRWTAKNMQPNEWLKQNGGKEPAQKGVSSKSTRHGHRARAAKPKQNPKPKAKAKPKAPVFQKADSTSLLDFGATPAPVSVPAATASTEPGDLMSAFGNFGVSSTTAAPPATSDAWGASSSSLDIDSLYGSAPAPAPKPATGMAAMGGMSGMGMGAMSGLDAGWHMNAMAPAPVKAQQQPKQNRGVPMAAQYQMGRQQQQQYGYGQPQHYGYQQQQQQQRQQYARYGAGMMGGGRGMMGGGAGMSGGAGMMGGMGASRGMMGEGAGMRGGRGGGGAANAWGAPTPAPAPAPAPSSAAGGSDQFADLMGF